MPLFRNQHVPIQNLHDNYLR